MLCANCHQDLHFDKERFKKYKNIIDNFEIKEYLPSLNVEDVISLYNQGMLQKDIAKKLNRSESIVSKIVNTSDKIIKREKILIDKNEVLKLYNSGMLQKDIAKNFNKCSKTIWRIINDKN